MPIGEGGGSDGAPALSHAERADEECAPGSEQRSTVVDMILVKRLGTPDDIARAVAFLLDDDAGFITGQALFVCGGTSVTGTGGQ